MNPTELQSLLNRTPFLPFRIHLADQSSFLITKPKWVAVGGGVTFIGMSRDVESDFFDEPVIVANRHITRVEPVVEQMVK